jgi:hypothetical protein
MSSLMNYLKLLILSVIMTWAVNVSGQAKNLSCGGGVGYNMTIDKELDYGTWYSNGFHGNFTPTITLRYGNKVSGVFKASYIQNSFEEEDFSQYGGTSLKVYKAKYHQVHVDFLFEHSPFGSRGFFYYLGPGIGIPVKVSLSEEFWKGAWGPNPAEHTYEEYTVPADFKLYIQGVFGIGGYVPIKEKNLISIECNFRFGFYKVPVNLSYTEDVRMIAIQFILGYLRRL